MDGALVPILVEIRLCATAWHGPERTLFLAYATRRQTEQAQDDEAPRRRARPGRPPFRIRQAFHTCTSTKPAPPPQAMGSIR